MYYTLVLIFAVVVLFPWGLRYFLKMGMGIILKMEGYKVYRDILKNN